MFQMLHVIAITLVAFAMAPALWRFTQSTISGSGKNFKRGRLWFFSFDPTSRNKIGRGSRTIGPVFVIAGNARTSRAVLALLSLLLVAAVNA